MSSTPYLRYPDLHGDRVAFVAEDDVWVAPLSGGRAWRVSSLQLPARNPKFSPDGSRIAWTVVQGGAPEVVTADTEGGDFRQLTFWGNQNTRVRGFSPAGKVIATSPFEFEDFRLRWAYEVPLDGSSPVRLPYGPLDTLAEGPALGDERPLVIGSVLSREPARWKRYRGGTAGKLWIDADGNGEFTRLVPELDGNLAYPMWVQGRIAFFSDHEGYGNIYSVTPQGTGLRRHTDFQDFYVRHPSSDGTRIIFESAGELWLMEDLDSEPAKLNIRLGSAGTGRRPYPLNAARHLKAAMPDTEGKSSVVESHGTLHWLTHKDGPSRVIEATAGVRARLGRPLPGGRAVFVADPGNEEALFIKDVFASLPSGHQVSAPAAPPVPAAAPEQPVLPRPVSAAGRTLGKPVVETAGPEVRQTAVHDTGADSADGAGASEAVLVSQDTAMETGVSRIAFEVPTRTAELLPSPDGKLVAVATEKGQVHLLDVDTRELVLIADEGHGAVEELAFSPDSRWLAWVEPVVGEGARSRIRLRETAGSAPETQDVTDGRFHDHSPSFTPDGRFLAFLSERSFDPVYDTHGFDLGFPTSTKPFMVALAAATPSPFGPAAHVVEQPKPVDSAVESDDPEGADRESTEVRVDRERLAERLIAVPVPQGRYSKLRAADGALLWLAEDVYGVTGDGRASSGDRTPGKRLERFDLVKKEVSVLVPALGDFELSGDGSTVLLQHEHRLRAVPATTRADEDSAESTDVDLSRIRVLLEPVKVWGQAFDEAWRLQRDFFWTPDMGGLDWDGVHARYRPLVENLGSHDDLVDLLWELHGELGTSHAYVTPASVAEAGAGAQGFLGADLRPGPGGWEVVRILDPESSDPQAISPLSAPGADVRPGDIIAAVDGLPVPADKGPAALLVGAAGRVVELTVLRPEEGSAPGQRRIAVIPLRSEERLRYQNWVNGNRRAVRSASEGRFGYLHIPDMVASGWAQLHRDLDSEAAKDALIIDVRHNRGGHTSQLVAELIGRKVTAWSLPRGEQPGTYPAQSPRGPVVLLTDEFAGSDGDIVTQVAKLRGIGPVIGTRTWGGVVGIDGRFALADGTGVTQPRYAYWFTGGIGFGVENRGVEPDIEVPYPPHAYAAGEDPQLEHGVGILKEMLSELPTDQPPAREGYPSLRPAPLPPRPQDTAAKS
ncbi:PDZ domain-containing protein [Arthrobacter sp. Sa2BUA2]|uniref:Tricorn protease homolog n=1 Tax=Arthrobacter pullicola TaxID=2762224 RepID=A0ABR8YL81_9MICC|nr:S41 family peptidase [Arthrobacter pullicola]MBD8045002.1 PDZ domain-containing protein [Arthrobacter pullicola]